MEYRKEIPARGGAQCGTKLTPVPRGPTRWSILSLMTGQIKHTHSARRFPLSICPSRPYTYNIYKIIAAALWCKEKTAAPLARVNFITRLCAHSDDVFISMFMFHLLSDDADLFLAANTFSQDAFTCDVRVRAAVQVARQGRPTPAKFSLHCTSHHKNKP